MRDAKTCCSELADRFHVIRRKLVQQMNLDKFKILTLVRVLLSHRFGCLCGRFHVDHYGVFFPVYDVSHFVSHVIFLSVSARAEERASAPEIMGQRLSIALRG